MNPRDVIATITASTFATSQLTGTANLVHISQRKLHLGQQRAVLNIKLIIDDNNHIFCTSFSKVIVHNILCVISLKS